MRKVQICPQTLLRSIKAYSETFNNKSDVMLIDSDSDFFKYLNQSKEK